MGYVAKYKHKNKITGKTTGPYREWVFSIRFGPGMVRKIYIKYIKIGERANPHMLQQFHNDNFSQDMHERITFIKENFETLYHEKPEIMKGNMQDIKQEDYKEALELGIEQRGSLNDEHRRMLKDEIVGKKLRAKAIKEAKVKTWHDVPQALKDEVQNKLKNYEPTMKEIDKCMKSFMGQDNIRSSDKVTGAMLDILDNNKYVNATIKIHQLEEQIEREQQYSTAIADMSGMGGHIDSEGNQLTSNEFKSEKSREIDILLNKLHTQYEIVRKEENENTQFKKSWNHIQTLVKKDQLHNIAINLNYDDNETRKLMREIRDVWANSKQNKILGLIKTRLKNITTSEQKKKLAFVNENLEQNNFHDMRNLYKNTIMYDWVSDYIDNGTIKPITIRTGDKSKTKDFYNELRNEGLLIRQFVEKEKGNSKAHIFPNFMAMIDHGESNLLLKYNGISKKRVSEILNHQSLTYVSSIVETTKDKRDIVMNELKAMNSGKINLSQDRIKQLKRDSKRLSKKNIFATMHKTHTGQFKKLYKEIKQIEEKISNDNLPINVKVNLQNSLEGKQKEHDRLRGISIYENEFAFLANIVQNKNRRACYETALDLFKFTDIFNPSQALANGIKKTNVKKLIAKSVKTPNDVQVVQELSEMDLKALEYAKELGLM